MITQAHTYVKTAAALPPPSPTQPQANSNNATNNSNSTSINILQFNCNGIKSKISEISDFMKEKNILIAALQETKLRPCDKTPNIPKYNFFRKDRKKDKGGGLAFLIHDSIQFQAFNPPASNDPYLEVLSVKINSLVIHNVYVPPTSSCGPNHSLDLNHLFNDADTIVLGDVNAHDPLWWSSIDDARGSQLSDDISNSEMGILNEDTPTRSPTNGQATSPDISLASLDLLPLIIWETHTALSSDHLPITLSIESTIRPSFSKHRQFINFKKANWNLFQEITEDKFAKVKPPKSVEKGEKVFRKIVNKAAKKVIPKGRIKEISPPIPQEAKDKMQLRDRIRSENPQAPEIHTLNLEIRDKINEFKREKWRETVESIDRKQDSSKLFKLIKDLNGNKTSKSENQAINFNGKPQSSAKKMANAFNVQYSSVKKHKSSKTARKTTKQLKKISDLPPPISDADTIKAFKASKTSKALVPDQLSPLPKTPWPKGNHVFHSALQLVGLHKQGPLHLEDVHHCPPSEAQQAGPGVLLLPPGFTPLPGHQGPEKNPPPNP